MQLCSTLSWCCCLGGLHPAFRAEDGAVLIILLRSREHARAEHCVCADHEGRFRGATKLKGIKDFQAKDYGLVPIQLDTWGQFVFIMADPSRCCSSFPLMPCVVGVAR
jgi:hypothetical protein